MLVDLIEKYKKLKQNDIQKIKYNQKIDNLLICFQDENNFSNLDIDNLINLLVSSNYSDYQIEDVKTTLTYIKRNNAFKDPSCKLFLQSISNYLTNLKEDILTSIELEQLISRVDDLLSSILNSDIFIEDIQLLIDIIKELKIDEDEMFSYILEINQHNLQLVNSLSKKNVFPNQKEKVKIEKIMSKQDLLKKYKYDINLTYEERKILDLISNKELEEKLEYFENTKEFYFLKQESNYQLLITLLGCSNLENIKNIHKIALKHEIDLKDILPIFYVSQNLKLDGFYDDYYRTLSGSYEDFIENVHVLEILKISVKKRYQESNYFFMMKNRILKENMRIFNEYGIPFDINSSSLLISLTANDLQRKLDNFIELGLYNYVKDYQSILLNKDKALFHRIYYAQTHNLPIIKRYLVSEITNIDGYQVNEENFLDVNNNYTSNFFYTSFYNEVYNSSKSLDQETSYNSLIKILDNNFLVDNNISYYIANNYISRPKVLRLFQGVLNKKDQNPNYFEGLLFSVLEGLMINKEEFDNIILEIMDTFLQENLIYFDVAVDICRNLNIDFSKIFDKFTNQERIK